MAIARRGISPVIATVIIVAVAIAISIAVAGWLFGLWGGFAGGSPAIQISTAVVTVTPDPNNNTTDASIDLYITNQGSGSDRLIRLEIISGGISKDTQLDITIPANFSGWLSELNNNNKVQITGIGTIINGGDSVTIKAYFEKSGVIPIQAVATE